MFPARFDYLAPTSVAEAVGALRTLGDDATVLAGGQSLIPLMKLRLATPAYLIDIGRLDELGGIRVDDQGGLVIGALTTEHDLERSELTLRRCPVLAEASAVVADPLVRSRATLGGNLAHADPANDHPAVMLALGAELLARGPDSDRVIPADEFFLGMFETSLAHDELLAAVRIPAMAPGSGCVYVKKERQAGDFAIAGAAAWVLIENGVIVDARVGLTNAGPTPARATAVEDRLRGEPAHARTAERAGRTAARDVDLSGSLRGTADYRRQIVGIAVEEALAAAVARAGGRAS
jgi:carbon-monoxide dehydrogenase medium subunit